jgi:hypothetical protein
MKRMLMLFLINWSLVLGALSAHSSQGLLQPKLVLSHMSVVKEQESNSDELYFDIKINRRHHSAQYIRIPKGPDHWSSHRLNKLEDIPLWSEPLGLGESIILIVSLIESDGSTLNPDDLIGLVRVKLTNEKGHLKSDWTMPNQLDGVLKRVNEWGPIKKIDLIGGAAHYQVYLSVH